MSSWATSGGCELWRRRTSYQWRSLLTVFGPRRRAHALEGEEIESEAAARRSRWAPPVATLLRWRLGGRVSRADSPSWGRGSLSAPPAQWSINLTILTRQALFGSCSLLSNISLFAPHSSCNGKSARATLFKLWSGMSALVRPGAERTLERCPAAPVDLSF